MCRRFLVGVEDEQTGELTLHDSGHAYALRQSVGGRQDSVEDHAMEGLEWKQRKDALVNQFGSKKKKAAIRCACVLIVVGGTALVSFALGGCFVRGLGGVGFGVCVDGGWPCWCCFVAAFCGCCWCFPLHAKIIVLVVGLPSTPSAVPYAPSLGNACQSRTHTTRPCGGHIIT